MGVVATDEALEIARKRNLDLVEVAPRAEPPVCKIMDFGKLKYQQKKRQKESRRVQLLKEITVRLKIGEHDLATKIRHMRRFLEAGHKVKLNVHLRGREKEYASSLGIEMLDRVAERLFDIGNVERKSGKIQGHRIHMILTPLKSGEVKHAKDENT